MLTILARDFAMIMADASIKAAVLLLFAVIVAIPIRRASAASRHCLWTVALGGILCLPILSPLLPSWRVSAEPFVAGIRALPHELRPAFKVPPGVTSGSPTEITSTAGPRPAAHVPLPHQDLPLPSALSSQPHWSSWLVWVFLGWFTGVLVVLAHLLIGVGAVMRLERASVLVTDKAMLETITTARNTVKVARIIQVRQPVSRESAGVPMTWGVLRPVVLLPFDAREWPVERLRAALLHEMAHIQRSDWLMQMLACAACAIYWFNPLAWLAARRMRAESERAADDLVLAAGMPATDYARHLLDVVRSAQGPRSIGVCAMAMAQTSQIEGRLRAVLAMGCGRRPISRMEMTVVLTVAGILFVTVARLHFVSRVQTASGQEAALPRLYPDFTLRYMAAAGSPNARGTVPVGTGISADLRHGVKTPGSKSPVEPRSVTGKMGSGGDSPGLLGEYYTGQNFNRLILKRLDRNIMFDWTGSRPDVRIPAARAFSIRWKGKIKPRYSDNYTFYTVADDGVRLWIDGKLIINNWTIHAPSQDIGQIALKANRECAIKLEYFEKNGTSQEIMMLSWQSPHQVKEYVPEACLFYPKM